MSTLSIVKAVATAGALLWVGLSPILPARAQDVQVHGRAIIRTPDGEQVIDLDPSTLPLVPGGGNHVVIMRAGPNGEVSTFVSGPDGFGIGGDQGFRLAGPAGAGTTGIGGINVIDPSVSYLYVLLRRIDVSEEIHLNARQREALEAAENGQQEARKQQIREGLQGLSQSVQGKSPQDLQAALAERFARMQEQAKSSTDQRLKTLASILRPEQFARLKELDLQYRGPMALAVTDVAKQADVTKEQSTQVSDILKEYRGVVTKSLAFGTRTVSLNQGQETGAAPPPNSEEMRVKLVKADKDIRKARIELSAKALSGLPAEKRAQWSRISGKPFEFHPAL